MVLHGDAIRYRAGVKTLFIEIAMEQLPKLGRVVDDEYFCRLRIHGCKFIRSARADAANP